MRTQRSAAAGARPAAQFIPPDPPAPSEFQYFLRLQMRRLRLEHHKGFLGEPSWGPGRPEIGWPLLELHAPFPRARAAPIPRPPCSPHRTAEPSRARPGLSHPY